MRPFTIDVVTLFPEMLEPALSVSMIGRARAAGYIRVELWGMRQYGVGRHRLTDDVPYGGGIGMVMRPEPFFRAVEAIRRVRESEGLAPDRIILLAAQGRTLTQAVVEELSRLQHLVLLCGHYEGIDDRVRQVLADDEISLGDFVLTGGEIPALALIDSVARLQPGVLPEGAAEEESFRWGLLEYPQYTRPSVYAGMSVPAVLKHGNAARIRAWRRQAALRRTLQRRPELLAAFRRSPAWQADPEWSGLWEQVQWEDSDSGTDSTADEN